MASFLSSLLQGATQLVQSVCASVADNVTAAVLPRDAVVPLPDTEEGRTARHEAALAHVQSMVEAAFDEQGRKRIPFTIALSSSQWGVVYIYEPATDEGDGLPRVRPLWIVPAAHDSVDTDAATGVTPLVRADVPWRRWHRRRHHHHHKHAAKHAEAASGAASHDAVDDDAVRLYEMTDLQLSFFGLSVSQLEDDATRKMVHMHAPPMQARVLELMHSADGYVLMVDARLGARRESARVTAGYLEMEHGVSASMPVRRAVVHGVSLVHGDTVEECILGTDLVGGSEASLAPTVTTPQATTLPATAAPSAVAAPTAAAASRMDALLAQFSQLQARAVP